MLPKMEACLRAVEGVHGRASPARNARRLVPCTVEMGTSDLPPRGVLDVPAGSALVTALAVVIHILLLATVCRAARPEAPGSAAFVAVAVLRAVLALDGGVEDAEPDLAHGPLHVDERLVPGLTVGAAGRLEGVEGEPRSMCEK